MLGREAAESLGPVLVDALQKVRRDAGVDRAVEPVRHDVDGGIALTHFDTSRRWMPGQARHDEQD
jgi:hypothetical protein